MRNRCDGSASIQVITMKRILFVLLLLCAGQALARVTQDGSYRWIIATPMFSPITATEQSLAPYTDGWLIQLHAGDGSVGFIATDTTNCTVAPCIQTNSFTTLDSYMTAASSFATLTCGATLHNNAGHPCYINFELQLMSNPNIYNKDTPAWVFDQPWATTVGSAVQDSIFCASFPQNGSASPASPASAVASLNSNNCGAGSSACTAATLSGGMPAPWETPFLAYAKGWLQQFFSYLKTASYLSQVKYFTVSIGVGTENDWICETQTGVAGTLSESIVTPATDAGLKTAFTTALTGFYNYAASTRQSLGLNFSLIARFAMANTLTAGVATDPTWAVAEVANAANFANTGVGSNGWKNYSGTNGSDLINIVGAAAACVIANAPACTSNNWSKAIPAVFGKVNYIIGENCNTSDPAGGAAHCLDSSASGTGTQADTLWQWFTLAGAAGVNVIELNPKDIQCIANLSPIAPCVGGNAIQLAYQGAAFAWARGQIPINH